MSEVVPWGWLATAWSMLKRGPGGDWKAVRRKLTSAEISYAKSLLPKWHRHHTLGVRDNLVYWGELRDGKHVVTLWEWRP